MKRLLRFLLPLLVLLGGIAISASLIATGPQTERQRPKTSTPTVEIMTLQPQDYQVIVASRGTLMPRTSSTLVPEVSGRIIQVADNFRNGGFFTAGEQLLQIDPRDYENAVIIARAELIQQQLKLAEEQAQSEQARHNWENLQLDGEPTPLLLRTPQLKNAEATLAAAEARLRQAEIELERTSIAAPYAGRILQKKVDLGQYIAPGTQLAEIYASDAVEIRLPISNEAQGFLHLPESDPNARQTANDEAPVLFSSRVGDQQHQWQGRLIRTEGSIDIRSRQLFVIGQIDAPYQPQTGRPALKIGQFLEAQIFGKQLKNVFVLPRQAVRGESTAHLIDADSRLQRRELDIIWRDEKQLIASGPLLAGERISLTTLPFAADGIKVQIAGESADKKAKKSQQEP
jgi:RND family efflux transporter MFP subunit